MNFVRKLREQETEERHNGKTFMGRFWSSLDENRGKMIVRSWRYFLYVIGGSMMTSFFSVSIYVSLAAYGSLALLAAMLTVVICIVFTFLTAIIVEMFIGLSGVLDGINASYEDLRAHLWDAGL